MEEEEENDIDPRTLQEAAARLAHYTSVDPMSSDPPHQQWTDLYKESGPDGVGAMGGEDAIDLVVLPADGSGGGGGGERSLAPPLSRWHLSCGAGRLLSAEAGGGGLLGLCDDVDCAVVSVSWPSRLPDPPKVVHESYVPALAYVVAGKMHKKHLLLGKCMPSGSSVDLATLLGECELIACSWNPAIQTRRIFLIQTRLPPI